MQTCSLFRDLSYADSLWLGDSRNSLITNGLDPLLEERTKEPLSARDKVRVSRNWTSGQFSETKLIVQNTRYMPRLQLEQDLLWVSWGNRIWAHPRLSSGLIDRTSARYVVFIFMEAFFVQQFIYFSTLKGHSDDVSRFVVKDGLLVSGGRDASIMGWNAASGEFLFSKRYCHGGDVCAVDFVSNSGLVLSGSRDTTVKLWEVASFRGYEDNRRVRNMHQYLSA